MRYDEIPEPIRHVLGCFEGYRRVGFRAEDIYCEPAPTRGLPDGQIAVFATLKAQGKEFRVECGQWSEKDIEALHEVWKRTCDAVNSGQVSQIDLDRIWLEGPIYGNVVGFMMALAAKGIRCPKGLS